MRESNFGQNTALDGVRGPRPLLSYRWIISSLSGRGENARLSILIYHRVLAEPDPLFPEIVDAKTFEQHIRFITSSFRVMPLLDAVHALKRGNLPSGAACVTFDDGYADNVDIALPILLKYGAPSTFFIASGFLDGGRMWNDTIIELVRQAPGPILDLDAIGFGKFRLDTNELRRRAIDTLLERLKYLPLDLRRRRIEALCALVPVALPNGLMMTSSQVKALHASGMEVGGHTKNHPILSRMESTEAYTEIAGGKEALEAIVRAPVRLFAYPNGKPNRDYVSDHVAMVRKSGFAAAVSTAWGTGKRGDDLYQLPRFTPWGRGSMDFAVRMAQNMVRKSQESYA